ncbi:efflux RND transporter periplasmic adaptor subunit [Pseudochrobactrum kiredjianiae]|uniref:Efflux RND transporter periplasmic adaptor subunit n=1 Tax=Pseudochrobactrum kiredjianiae TaxID=386305 RepID=A0ABW3V6G3_9HYPH|nr:efflux RND transporter periplasmic adaptor subunit [Pseudochrobactrum kiredjianiae]MDM7850740.1 efflux RND transporter periplasmic adaptor subunit [Pseudochrobactrum kiredjianiae]
MNGRPNKKRGFAKKWLFWLLVIAGLAAVLYYFTAGYFKTEAPKIMTATVHKGDIETTVLATGILKPARLVAVGAQASGRVLSLSVKAGQQVKKDDLIAQIDATTQQNELRKAKADEVRNQADREDKIAKLELAKQDMTRQQQMISRNAISRADFDKAVSTVKSAEAQIASADALIVSSKIAVETAEANLGYTQIRAPIDGTILATVVQEGQTVNAVQSAPTIAIIGQLDTMTVEADISEADVINVKEGQDLYFTIPGQSDKRYTAQLQTLEPAPQSIVSDKSFGTSSAASSSTASASAIYYKGIFDIANPDGVLKTYMTAEIHIILGSAKDVLLIPSTALSEPDKKGQITVSVMGKNGIITQKPVETGLNDKVMVEIRSGLTEGEKVVTGDNAGGPAVPRSNRGRSIRF